MKLEPESSPELTTVKNSIASIYGNLKKDYNRGYSTILEVLQEYENSIGIYNQKYCIALQWKGWYLNKLDRPDECIVVAEQVCVLNYQVFGPRQQFYLNTVNDLVSYYNKRFDSYERMQRAFIDEMEKLIKTDNIKKAEIYFEIANTLYSRIAL